MVYAGIEFCLFHCHVTEVTYAGYLLLAAQFTAGHSLCIISALLCFQLLGHALDRVLNVLFLLLFKLSGFFFLKFVFN